MADITVACVLRSGGIYTAKWVQRLQRGVARHLPTPHRFVCLSDVEVPCERIPLETDWPGWWSKVELFKPGLFAGRILYFDLDSVVTGSLEAIAAYPHQFTMAHEFYRPHLLCSTAMAWQGDYSHLHDDFAAAPVGLAHHYDIALPALEQRVGDQAFIEDRVQHVDTFRDLFGERCIASYKVHKCQDAPPADAAAVSFHGQPKPHQINSGWVVNEWR